MQQYFPFFMFSFLTAIIWSRVLSKPALHIGLVDVPGGRKKHDGSIPLVGGVAIFLSFLFTILLLDTPLRQYAPFFAGMALLLITGLLDDLIDLSAKKKLCVQVLAALFVTSWGGNSILEFGNILGLGNVVLYGWSIPITVIAITGCINAFNMLDGIDGLAGGASVIAFIWLGIAAILTNNATHVIPLFILIFSIIGFLSFNIRHPWRTKASLFLGDSGSMILGFSIAWFAIFLTQGQTNQAISPSAVLWILALPLIDTVCLMIRRVIKGKSPFCPGRDHLHHILIRAGFSVTETTSILLAFAFVTGGIGVIGCYMGVPDYILFGGFLLLFVMDFYCLSKAWKMMKAIKRLKNAKAKSAALSSHAKASQSEV